MALTFFTFKKGITLMSLRRVNLLCLNQFFLFSLIFSPGGKRHKNEIVQDISYFALTSFAKPTCLRIDAFYLDGGLAILCFNIRI